MASKLHLELALTPDGWRRDVVVRIDHGVILGIEEPGRGEAQRVSGVVLPGLPNLHSHAFQRAMAGLTERAGRGGEDNFWTWREVMYRFLAALDPDAVEAIATWLYIELVCAGYTQVVEFHYLHHDKDGQPYADRAELSLRIVRAAQRAGISLTLLPVLYTHGGFGGAPPTPGQRRFLHTFDDYASLVERLAPELGRSQVKLGLAPHSLRAVTPQQLQQVIALADALARSTNRATPIHLHIAEQQAEVTACQAVLGTTPVAWLLDNAPVDARFCLVHATHMTPAECERLAQSGAVAGLCPTTEGNLGDGLFDAPRYLQQGGRFGVGTDSNVCVDPFEELRIFEYGQRLSLRRRNVLAAPGESVGGTLFRAAQRGGAQAAGQPLSGICVGAPADVLVLDDSEVDLHGRRGDAILDAALFGPRRGVVRDVIIGGRFVVKQREHAAAAAARAAYLATLGRLL
jgi:formimidoylglutamate deiminase